MSDSWDERRRAQEEEFFDKQNKAALERLKDQAGRKLPSPVTGEPMETIAIRGVVVDRCKTSGGIWLDAGELEQIIKSVERDKEHSSTFSFIRDLFGSER